MIIINLNKFSTLLLLPLCIAAFLVGCSTEDPLPISEPAPQSYVQHGRNLVKGLAACGFCHGERSEPDSVLSGGQVLNDKYGEVIAPNLTPAKSGLLSWSTLDLIKLFRSGVTPSEDRISNELHKGIEWMADSDLLAVISYIKNIPPIENEVERRGVGFLSRNTTGFLESEGGVSGFVPEIDKSYQLEYGEYLAKHVARCSVCHTQPSTLISSERYLGGGKIIKNSHGEKLAPNITPSEQAGIGSWSEDQIVAYLKTGQGPGNRISDPNFCPVGFYKNALPEDLIALAKYLRSVTPID